MLSEDQITLVRRDLHRGHYNLLIGAGISGDSTNGAGNPIIGTEELRHHLCEVKKLNSGSSLSRAASYLTKQEIEEQLTRRFGNCKAGPTVMSITEWVWSQIFTLNIDDALENAYRTSASTRLQNAIPVNYTRPYETFRHRAGVPIIHLHGYVQEPDTPYVFSIRDYSKTMSDLCAWMHVLSQLIETEPFIVSGTSLAEPDLEFYLSKRVRAAHLRNRGLSFLVEPYPDAGTVLDCERFGLFLVESTLSEFLSYLGEQIGPSPDVGDIVTPSKILKYKKSLDEFTKIAFFSDFELVTEEISKPAGTKAKHSFYFGRPPTWHDIIERIDVVLKEQLKLKDPAYTWISKPTSSKVLIGIGYPGAGKTTTLKRVAAELSEEFENVFYMKTQDGLDTQSCIAFLQSLEEPSMLFVDNIAERADNIQTILDDLNDTTRVLVIGVERNYRQKHLESIFENGRLEIVRLGTWTREERLRLIESFQVAGLTGHEDALKSPLSFVNKIEKVPAAEAVCMILNDFRPLRNIVASLWNDANDHQRAVFLIVALAHYCQPQGVRYSIASTATKFDTAPLVNDDESPLPLTDNSEDSDFLLPLNVVVGARLVATTAKEKPARMLDAFKNLGSALAPYVTRITIMQQTAEARLAGRLFNVEDIVRPLLGDQWDIFFEAVKPAWQWNSRYWEQRALGMSSIDLPLGIQYARHALAIEDHPFPRTTLAKLLFQQVVQQPGLAGSAELDEALQLCKSVFLLERDGARRVSKAPYFVFFGGLRAYLENGGTVTGKQKDFIEKACADGNEAFPRDTNISSFASLIRRLLAAQSSADTNEDE